MSGHFERPSTSGLSKLKRRRTIATSDGPQPSGLQESDEVAEEPNDKTEEGEYQLEEKQVKRKKKRNSDIKLPREVGAATAVEEGENQLEDKQVKRKKKRNSDINLAREDGAATDENRKRRKRKSINLKCKPCCLSIRRASMGRHCKRFHGFPADAKWVREEHPEVESESEEKKTYVFDPADNDDDDFVDPNSPIEVLKRKVERQDMKIVLLEDQNILLKHRYVGMEKFLERQQKEMDKLREENKQLKQAQKNRLDPGERGSREIPSQGEQQDSDKKKEVTEETEKIRLDPGESSSLERQQQGEQQDSDKKKEVTEETEKIRLDPDENNSFKKEDIDAGKMPKVVNE